MATFRSGDPKMVPYTTGAAHNSGDIVALGSNTGVTVGVMHHEAANGAETDIAIGGGVYEETFGENVSAWNPVYWDAGNNVMTGAANTGILFGVAVEAGVANATSKVLHYPFDGLT